MSHTWPERQPYTHNKIPSELNKWLLSYRWIVCAVCMKWNIKQYWTTNIPYIDIKTLWKNVWWCDRFCVRFTLLTRIHFGFVCKMDQIQHFFMPFFCTLTLKSFWLLSINKINKINKMQLKVKKIILFTLAKKEKQIHHGSKSFSFFFFFEGMWVWRRMCALRFCLCVRRIENMITRSQPS